MVKMRAMRQLKRAQQRQKHHYQLSSTQSTQAIRPASLTWYHQRRKRFVYSMLMAPFSSTFVQYSHCKPYAQKQQAEPILIGDDAEPEEGEIINSDSEFEYEAISSDEEFTLRQQIEALEAKNRELEKIASISSRAIDYDYISGKCEHSHLSHQSSQQEESLKSRARILLRHRQSKSLFSNSN